MTANAVTSRPSSLGACVELRDLRLRTDIGTYGAHDVLPDAHVLDLTLAYSGAGPGPEYRAETVAVYENVTGTTDSRGVPAYSVEAIVLGPTSPTSGDDSLPPEAGLPGQNTNSKTASPSGPPVTIPTRSCRPTSAAMPSSTCSRAFA